MNCRVTRFSFFLTWSMLLMIRSALAQDACTANFTHGGNSKSGLTFGSSAAVTGINAASGIAQMKSIAAADGFEIGAESYQGGQGTLTIQQKSSTSARGFPAFITASDTGNVAINMTLPAGMTAKPEDVRHELCGMLSRLTSAGATNTSTAITSANPALTSTATTNRPTMASAFGPVESTKLCMANFTTALSGTEAGNTYSTWSMASSLDPHDAVARMKKAINAVQDYSVASEDYHGHEAQLMVVMKSANTVRDSAFRLGGPDTRGFPFYIDVDGDLAAISFVAHVNPDQTNIIAARIEYVACGLIALAAGSEAPPAPPKSGAVADTTLLGQPSGLHFVNPFTNTPQARAKRAQEEADTKLQTRRDASTTLYRRALASGKAVVVVPGINTAEKYKNAGPMTPGSANYPQYSVDLDSTIIWKSRTDEKDVLKVGFKQSMDRAGLHGYLTGLDVGKSYYMFYIVQPGTYSISGTTYELRRAQFPDMSVRQWSSKPQIGMASLSATRDKEFYQTQQWYNAQYGTQTISDGSYCDMMISGGGVTGCGHVQEMSHQETYVKDPGGWREVTRSTMVDGVALATKLSREFASFTVSPGEAVVVDGFYADSYNTALNTNACNQADSNLVNCSIKTFNLYRITSHLEDIHEGPRNPLDLMYLVNEHVPFDANLFQYRQVKVVATPGEEKPGAYEAAWAKPYLLSTR